MHNLVYSSNDFVPEQPKYLKDCPRISIGQFVFIPTTGPLKESHIIICDHLD